MGRDPRGACGPLDRRIARARHHSLRSVLVRVFILVRGLVQVATVKLIHLVIDGVNQVLKVLSSVPLAEGRLADLLKLGSLERVVNGIGVFRDAPVVLIGASSRINIHG